ncbi:telomerase reverse transcriptase-like, partial [Centruroides sculpturatus]|uniref:telomerase reverse transcriptase-like n=1 Tax=Centruroides sculpturatus TaxID=218467 RepID=UPI000C6E47CE
MDLQDCFGSMNQDKLLEIVQDVFEKFGESCYQIRKYYILYEEKEKIKLKFVRCASFVSETFFQYILKSRKNIRNAVFINLGTEEYLDLNNIIRIIKIYVTNCIVKIGKIYYRLNKGISQGGSLSMMLCNLYLAALEKECLSEFGKNSEELLMRFVDDFIFITPFKDRADHFMKIMLSGLVDFNLQVNPNKIIVNFSTETKSVTVLENEEKLKWLGLLINPNTLNVSVDYTRYFGLSIGYSMSIDLKNAGYNLKKKMLVLVILRFLPITLDTYINTEDVAVVNLFESFLLLAYRMHHVIKNWQPKRRMQNPLFLLVFAAFLLIAGFVIEIQGRPSCVPVRICRKRGGCYTKCRNIGFREVNEDENVFNVRENEDDHEALEDMDIDDNISRDLDDEFQSESENMREEERDFDDFLESDAWENESLMKKRTSDEDEDAAVREIDESSEDAKRELIREEMENEFRELLESDEAENEIREVMKDMEKENV